MSHDIGAARFAAAGTLCVRRDRRSADVAALDRTLSNRWRGHDPLGDSRLAGLIRTHGVPVGSGVTQFLAIARRAFGDGPYSAPLGATFVVARGDGPARVAPRSVARTAMRLTPYLAARPASIDDVASLSAVLERGTCYTVSGGEPNSTARAILATLRAADRRDDRRTS